jgi:hypothetical protein
MIVTINAEIFNNPNNNSDLNDIMHFFRKGKHTMNLKKPGDFVAFENSEWTKTLSRSDKDFLRESSQAQINKREIVISNSDNEIEFNTKEAYYYLQQNLKIILEQEEYEKPFILKILQEFDTTKELINSLQEGWLEFYNGAGSNSESILRTRITRNIDTNQNFKDPLNKYLRFYEIKDSDREYCIINSDETITEQELPDYKTRFLEQENIPYHILYKREKENYMPDSVFNSLIHFQDKKEFIQVYFKLTPSQKDFLDMEKGFVLPRSNPKQTKERANLINEVRNLYDILTDEQYRKIGFGFPISNFKSTFSNYFNNVSKDDLEKRIQHQPKLKSKLNPKDTSERNEFEHIIYEIKYLL